MRRSAFVSMFLAVVVSSVVGCSGPSTSSNQSNAPNNASSANGLTESREYPTSVRTEFVKACEASVSPGDFCACVFEKVQKQYTFEEFSVIESKIHAEQAPVEFVEFSGKARAQCTK